MVAGYRAPIESTLVVAETEFEPTTKFSLPRRVCVSNGKGKAKSAGGPVCITRATDFSFSLAA